MMLNTAPIGDARDFAYSWIQTADEINPLPKAMPVVNGISVEQHVYVHHAHNVDRIQPTIFEWLFWNNLFSSPRQNITYNITNVYTGSVNETKEKKEKKDESDGLVMVIGGIAVLFSAVVGFAISFRELHKANKLSAMAQQYEKNRNGAISAIAQNALEILQRRVSKLAGCSISTAGLIIGGAAMFVGGFFAIPIVGQVGVVVTVVFAVCLLYTTAEHWSDSDDDFQCYQAIQKQRDGVETLYEAYTG